MERKQSLKLAKIDDYVSSIDRSLTLRGDKGKHNFYQYKNAYQMHVTLMKRKGKEKG
jgi:hypothetical protein